MSEKAPKFGEFQDGKLWFTRKGNLITVGLTSLAIEEVGDIEKIEMPEESEDFVKGDAIGNVVGSTGELELTIPATGSVNEINSAVAGEPSLASDDPLEEGWLLKIEIEDPAELKEFGVLTED